MACRFRVKREREEREKERKGGKEEVMVTMVGTMSAAHDDGDMHVMMNERTEEPV